MLRGVRRRLAHLEESIPIPLTAERFLIRANIRATRTGGGLGSAITTLLGDLSDNELDSLQAEFEQAVFGSDTEARDKARRETLAAAGYPDWINEIGQERRAQA